MSATGGIGLRNSMRNHVEFEANRLLVTTRAMTAARAARMIRPIPADCTVAPTAAQNVPVPSAVTNAPSTSSAEGKA